MGNLLTFIGVIGSSAGLMILIMTVLQKDKRR